jgi:hypothetical protein
MTHGELLEKISFKKNKSFYLREALRAVVELHKPKDGKKFCKTCGKFFPCSTIQAIEKELN